MPKSARFSEGARLCARRGPRNSTERRPSSSRPYVTRRALSVAAWVCSVADRSGSRDDGDVEKAGPWRSPRHGRDWPAKPSAQIAARCGRVAGSKRATLHPYTAGVVSAKAHWTDLREGPIRRPRESRRPGQGQVRSPPGRGSPTVSLSLGNPRSIRCDVCAVDEVVLQGRDVQVINI